jgi:hypothetical protein
MTSKNRISTLFLIVRFQTVFHQQIRKQQGIYEAAVIFMTYLCIKCHMNSFSGLLAITITITITIRSLDKESVRTDAMLLFFVLQQYYLARSYIFFEPVAICQFSV